MLSSESIPILWTVKNELTIFEIYSIASSIEMDALKSVFWTALGGIPDKKDAWFNPLIITTGKLYLDLLYPIDEFFI